MNPGLLLTYYGDDFSGSTDAMEALATAGLPTLLFLVPPDAEALARRPDLRAVGIAGISRSQPPSWMDANLPGAFRALRRLDAPICHYKTCSTFDSAPHVGSIGRAIDIGQDVFGTACVPVVVGVPQLRRYVVFGTLFAAAGSEVFRIDRHPVMSRHPTTPMREAELARHLAQQTSRPIAGLDFTSLLAEDAAARYEALSAQARIVILDTFDAATSRVAGRLLRRFSESGPRFVAGSSGVEYALIEALRESGELPASAPALHAGPVDRIAIVSGSGSPTTAAQIRWAEANDFLSIPLEGPRLISAGPSERAEVLRPAITALRDGRSVVLHTAAGPDDPRIAETRAALNRANLASTDSAEILGRQLGLLLSGILAETDLRRAVIAGGDSSGHAAQALGISALEMIAPLVPGSPLCRVEAADSRLRGLEIVMKGGQVGPPDYFDMVRRGSTERPTTEIQERRLT